jgi:hypothetical protein
LFLINRNIQPLAFADIEKTIKTTIIGLLTQFVREARQTAGQTRRF